jgi:hypothetical protein
LRAENVWAVAAREQRQRVNLSFARQHPGTIPQAGISCAAQPARKGGGARESRAVLTAGWRRCSLGSLCRFRCARNV